MPFYDALGHCLPLMAAGANPAEFLLPGSKLRCLALPAVPRGKFVHILNSVISLLALAFFH